jgi:hypothetical protein
MRTAVSPGNLNSLGTDRWKWVDNIKRIITEVVWVGRR